MHYSASSESEAGYLNDLKSAPWFDKVRMHFSDQGNRADFNKIIPYYSKNDHLKKFMTSNPLFVSETAPASKALSIMNEKKITCLLVRATERTL